MTHTFFLISRRHYKPRVVEFAVLLPPFKEKPPLPLRPCLTYGSPRQSVSIPSLFSSSVITSRSLAPQTISLVSSSELSLRAVRAFLLLSLRLIRPTRYIQALSPSHRTFPGGRSLSPLDVSIKSTLWRPPSAPLRSVIKRKSTNYNWRTARNAGAAAANNPNRSEQTADATQKESKQRDRFAQFRSFCWRHDSKMDYVTVSLCCV